MTAAIVSLAVALAATISLAVALMFTMRKDRDALSTVVDERNKLQVELGRMRGEFLGLEQHIKTLINQRASLRSENANLHDRMATNAARAINRATTASDLARLGDELFSGEINSRADDRDFADDDRTPPMQPAALARAISAGGSSKK